MTERTMAIKSLLTQAEDRAIRQRIPLMKAMKYVVREPSNFRTLTLACGGFWKAKPPSDRQLRKWRDSMKVYLAKKYPNISAEQLQVVVAYLPVSKRPKMDKTAPNKAKATRLLEMGYSKGEVAKELDLPRSTAYRLIGTARTYDKSTDWHDQAIKLRDQGLTFHEIAEHLGKNYLKIQRFFAKWKNGAE